MIAIELDSTFLTLRLRIATLPMIGNKVDVQAIRGLISAILVENDVMKDAWSILKPVESSSSMSMNYAVIAVYSHVSHANLNCRRCCPSSSPCKRLELD